MITQISQFFLAMRPKQWIKNTIIFVPLFFSKVFLTDYSRFTTVSLIFFLFSFLVGSTYILDDYKDLEKDKEHPVKKNRPLASGKLNATFALYTALFVAIGSVIGLYFFGNIWILGLSILYVINTILYTFFLKKKEIVEIFSIALGFLIRGFIGIIIINAEISCRFIVTILIGSLFFGFFKRYQEIMGSKNTRTILTKYSPHFLEVMVIIFSTILMLVYLLYTFNSMQSQRIVLSFPFFIYVIIRFLYHLFVLKKFEQGIEDIFFGDKNLLISTGLYVLSCIGVLIFA